MKHVNKFLGWTYPWTLMAIICILILGREYTAAMVGLLTLVIIQKRGTTINVTTDQPVNVVNNGPDKQ